jgi:hypothetical protein
MVVVVVVLETPLLMVLTLMDLIQRLISSYAIFNHNSIRRFQLLLTLALDSSILEFVF